MLSEQNDQSLEKVSALMFHAPVAIILLKGPSHTVEIANGLERLLWRKSGEDFLRRPLLESLPELAAQGNEDKGAVFTVMLPLFSTSVAVDKTSS